MSPLPAAGRGQPGAIPSRLATCAVLVQLALVTAASAQTLQAGPPSAPVVATLYQETARVELEGRRLVDVALGREAEVSSLVAAGDRWLLAGSRVAVDGRRRLAIVAGDDLGWREIPAPGGLPRRARNGAVLLGDPDGFELRSELVIAWLEGDGTQRQSVHAARYRDGGFEEPELVAAAGPGSQVALRGAVLADGTPLLVWNAFDGTDNEIVWSWYRAGAWSRPERLGEDNQVPDVSPVLAASGTGAIAAWSRYDGRNYRIVVARLDGSAWSTPTPIAGAGSMPARLLMDGESPVLVYQEAAPRRWTVARLNRHGSGATRVSTSASVTSPRSDPPIVALPAPALVELDWAAESPHDPPVLRRPRGSLVVPWRPGPPAAGRSRGAVR
ncbi:MAG TPA: hypothetical protein VMT85_12750 [Thermoanaerobaculia bacterium]|nr:hypothetical protein [Thermoanaerobaculia bacterium]